MSADIEEIFRAVGVNRYYVMSSNELKVVYLTKVGERMDNWLLIVVAGIFLICIAVGYIRDF